MSGSGVRVPAGQVPDALQRSQARRLRQVCRGSVQSEARVSFFDSFLVMRGSYCQHDLGHPYGSIFIYLFIK